MKTRQVTIHCDTCKKKIAEDDSTRGALRKAREAGMRGKANGKHECHRCGEAIALAVDKVSLVGKAITRVRKAVAQKPLAI